MKFRNSKPTLPLYLAGIAIGKQPALARTNPHPDTGGSLDKRWLPASDRYHGNPSG